MHGSPGCVAFTQPSPTAFELQPSVPASQLTSCASTALRLVGKVMHPCPAAVARQVAAVARRNMNIGRGNARSNETGGFVRSSGVRSSSECANGATCPLFVISYPLPRNFRTARVRYKIRLYLCNLLSV
jgi:hypothetical protein